MLAAGSQQAVRFQTFIPKTKKSEEKQVTWQLTRYLFPTSLLIEVLKHNN